MIGLRAHGHTDLYLYALFVLYRHPNGDQHPDADLHPDPHAHSALLGRSVGQHDLQLLDQSLGRELVHLRGFQPFYGQPQSFREDCGHGPKFYL